MSNEIKSETTLTLKTAIAEIGKTSPINLSLLLSKENDCRLEISGDGYNLFIYGIENLSQLIHDLDRMKMKWADYENPPKKESSTPGSMIKNGGWVTAEPNRISAAVNPLFPAICDDGVARYVSYDPKLCQCRECKD